MNMKKYNLLCLMVVAALLTGCASNDFEGGAKLDSADVPILLTAMLEGQPQIATRAGIAIQNTQFEADETFYAFFPTGVRVGNVDTESFTPFTTTNTSGDTSPATQPYFNAGVTSATVHTYYPYYVDADDDSKSVRVTNASESFSVQLDQSADLGYKNSDLMYATATIQKSNPTGELTFSHKMSKILVNVTLGSGVSSVTGVNIVGGYRTIAIPEADRLSCTLSTDPGDLSDANSASGTYVTMFSGSYSPTIEAPGPLACAALLPPQTIGTAQAAAPFLQIVTNSGTATFNLSKELVSGNCYTINLTVTSASIGLATTINPWDVEETPIAGTVGFEGLLNISNIDDQTCTGTGVEPSLDVICKGIHLTSSDYDAYYTDNIYPGTATVVVVGKGSYAGLYGNGTFTILTPSISDITRNMVGWLITTDGKVYPNKSLVDANNKTAVALIGYVRANNTEYVDASSLSYRGLAIGLTDASPSQGINWGGDGTVNGVGSGLNFLTGDSNDASIEIAGISNTTKLQETYTSGYAANTITSYTPAAPTSYGTSGWFLPGMGQWFKILNGTLGLTWSGWGNNDNYTVTEAHQVIRKIFVDAGYESAYFSNENYYWSSSQASTRYAAIVSIANGTAFIAHSYRNKNAYVRPFFAF